MSGVGLPLLGDLPGVLVPEGGGAVGIVAAADGARGVATFVVGQGFGQRGGPVQGRLDALQQRLAEFGRGLVELGLELSRQVLPFLQLSDEQAGVPGDAVLHGWGAYEPEGMAAPGLRALGAENAVASSFLFLSPVVILSSPSCEDDGRRTKLCGRY